MTYECCKVSNIKQFLLLHFLHIVEENVFALHILNFFRLRGSMEKCPAIVIPLESSYCCHSTVTMVGLPSVLPYTRPTGPTY